MNTEQEALAVELRLIAGFMHDPRPRDAVERAAAMLRKLVAEREADRAAMRRALEALEDVRNAEFFDPYMSAITHLRQRLEGTTSSKNAVWVVRSYSKITNQRISESIDLDSYEKAVALRNQWEANPDFSVGMFAQIERLGQ